MKISVALCTYNGQTYLGEQLTSLLTQSRLPDEVVVSDDASTDATMSIVQQFADKASFAVHILVNQNNVGTSENFNRAIEACSGDVIALCDQDDVWLPQKLAIIEQAFNEHANAGYVFSDANVVGKDLAPLTTTETSLWQSVGFTHEDVEMFLTGDSAWQVQRLLRRTLVTGTTMAFRSNLRPLVLPLSPAWVHDAWISLLLSIFGAVGVPISQPLVKYRQHEAQQLGVRSGLAIHSPQVSNADKFNIFRKMSRRDKLEKRLEAQVAMQALWDYIISQQQRQGINISERIMLLIQSHRQHLQSRILAYESSGVQRWGIILRSLISGGYHVHSNRYASIIKDTLC